MKISRYLAGNLKIDLEKFHEKRLRIDQEIVEKHAIYISFNVTAGI